MAKGAGVDCVGLILGVGFGIGALEISEDEWAPFNAYSRSPNPKKMGEAMSKWLSPVSAKPVKIEDLEAGMILWIQWRADLPMHLAIVSTFKDRTTMIHAYQNVGKCVEHGIDDKWFGLIHSVWKYPDT